MSGKRDSNPRPPAWKASALSTELFPQKFLRGIFAGVFASPNCKSELSFASRKTSAFSVGADGFEPPKSRDSRFTVCPIWPLWNTPPYFENLWTNLMVQSVCYHLFNVHRESQLSTINYQLSIVNSLRASSRTRTNDRWITNLVLYQLSYRGQRVRLEVLFRSSPEPFPTKAGAKVLLFFDMTKYFGKKISFFCIFP